MKQIKFKTLKDVGRKFNKRSIVGKIREIKPVLFLSAALSVATTLGGVMGHYGYYYSNNYKAHEAFREKFRIAPVSTLLAAPPTTVSSYIKDQSDDGNIFDQAYFFSELERSLTETSGSKVETPLPKAPLFDHLDSVNPHAKLLDSIQAINNEVHENQHITNIYNPFSDQPIGIVSKDKSYEHLSPDYLQSTHGKRELKLILGSYNEEAIKGGVIMIADKRAPIIYGTKRMFKNNEDFRLYSILREMANLSDHAQVHRQNYGMEYIPGKKYRHAAEVLRLPAYLELRRDIDTELESEADTTALLAMIKIRDMSKPDAIQMVKNALLWRVDTHHHIKNPIRLGFNDRVVLIDLIDNHLSEIKNMDMSSIPALSHFINEFSSRNPLPHRVRAVLAEAYGETKKLSADSISYANNLLSEEYLHEPSALTMPVDSIPAHHSISLILNKSLFGLPRSYVKDELIQEGHLDNRPTPDS